MNTRAHPIAAPPPAPVRRRRNNRARLSAPTLSVCVLALAALGCLSHPAAATDATADVPCPLPAFVATNIPAVENCVKGTSLLFDSPAASPPGADHFFLRWRFTLPPEPAEAWYSLVLTAGRGPGSIGQSRFSWVVDGGDVRPALRAQRVLWPAAGVHAHVQPPVRLAAGEHTLELRFHPDQRLRLMNRATEAFTRHHVDLHAMAWRRVDAPAPAERRRALSPHGRLRSGDRIVLFGDSITEEEYYGRHLVRILGQLFPDSGITVYNAGVSLNRTLEGVARLEADVLPHAPDWVVLAFGVNDAMQLAPEDYARHCAAMVRRLRAEKIGVVCASPSGMMPGLERFGDAVFSMHASDRASGIDRSMAENARLLAQVAASNDVLFADVHGAFTRTPLPRLSLMANQWHPGDEGGRMLAVCLLRAFGVAETEMAASDDARDLLYYRALAAMAPAPPAADLAPQTPATPLRGTVLFATAYGDNRLLAFTPDGRLLAALPTPHHPAALAWAPTRRELYVACEGAGRLLVYALPDLRLTDTVDLGLEAYPTGLALAADEATLWIGSFFGSRIIELDLASRRPRRELPMPGIVNGVALAPDGKTLLVSLPGKLAFVDATAGTVTAVVDTVKFTGPCLRLPDGRVALVDAERWQLLPVDVARHRLDAPVPAPAQTRALAVDPHSGHLFAADWMNRRLLEFDGARRVGAVASGLPLLALCAAHADTPASAPAPGGPVAAP